VGIEYVVIMVVYEYSVYKVSLGYVASTCALFALRVCGFTCGIGYVALALVYCCPADMWLYILF